MERKCSRIKFRNLGYTSQGCPKFRKSEKLENSVTFGHSHSGPQVSEIKSIQLFSFTQKTRDWNGFFPIRLRLARKYRSSWHLIFSKTNLMKPLPPLLAGTPYILWGKGDVFFLGVGGISTGNLI